MREYVIQARRRGTERWTTYQVDWHRQRIVDPERAKGLVEHVERENPDLEARYVVKGGD